MNQVEFSYAGAFYEFVIRAWFELQDKWSTSTAEALEYINKKDKKFYQLLNDFVSRDLIKRSETANALFKLLNTSRINKAQ
jgi:hypothetical protein